MTTTCTKVGLEYFETAPVMFRASEVIDATPDEVFAVFLDAASWTRWVFAITRVEWTSPFPLAVGSTRSVYMRGGIVGHEEFLAWEPGSRMAFRFNEVSKGGITAFAEDYNVTDLLDGSCRVDWIMAMTPGGAARHSMALMRPLMGVATRRMLRQLRRYVESRPQLEGTS